LLLLAEGALRLFVRLADVEAGLYRPEAGVGWLTRPNLRVALDLKRPRLRFVADTNSLGLRGEREIVTKRPDETRVLVLGDSFTWGIGVESNQTFVALLERRLQAGTRRQVTVVNGGMPNYGTAQELVFYRRYADRLSADVVVLAYYPNDERDNVTRTIYADGYLWNDPILVAGHPLFLVEWGRRLFAGAGVGVGASTNERAVTLALIAELRRDCQASQRPLLVLQLPARETTGWAETWERRRTYRPLPLPNDELVTVKSELEALATSPYLPEHHLNAVGHQAVADVLAAALSSRLPGRF
jgi:lysophospholipase L1-like esterase